MDYLHTDTSNSIELVDIMHLVLQSNLDFENEFYFDLGYFDNLQIQDNERFV